MSFVPHAAKHYYEGDSALRASAAIPKPKFEISATFSHPKDIYTKVGINMIPSFGLNQAHSQVQNVSVNGNPSSKLQKSTFSSS